MRARRLFALLVPSCLVAFSACKVEDVGKRDSSRSATGSPVRLAGWRAEAWVAPSLDSLGDDPASRSIRRGHALFVHTRDSLPGFVGGNLNCSSCHLDAGRRPTAIPLFGVAGIYPRYNARADAVVPIEDRVNYCFTRSLAGSRLPGASREMQDMIAYLAFLGRGVPGGTTPMPISLAAMPKLAGDSARGASLFPTTCARCHGADGAGLAIAPALWGAKSFSVGASMAREERAASFIQKNMPFDTPGTLTDQQAYDVAAYITSLSRPDMPGKERDWPKGDAPSDVPYATAKHTPVKAPKLLPRRNPEKALVPPPATVRR